MKRIEFLSLLILTVALAACGGGGSPSCNLKGGLPLAATSWPKFRGDLANTGRSPVDLSGFAPSGELSKQWEVVTGGVVTSSAAIGLMETMIFIGSADSRVYAITKDGVVVWQAVTSNTVTSGPAIDTDGNVFVTSNDGNLYTLDPDTGQGIRGIATISGSLSSPTLATVPNPGVIYIGSLTTGLFAVCPNTVARWISQLVPVGSTPAIDAEGNVYSAAANSARNLLQQNPTNGQVNWNFTTTAAINASPIVAADGTIYAIDSLGRLFGVDPDTGTSPGVLFDLTQRDPGAQVVASPALGTDGTLYVADTHGGLWAIDPSTLPAGVRWTAQIGAGIYSSPVVTPDRTIIFGADDGVVYALSDLGDTAAVRWTFQTDGAVRSSAAIAADGTIYIGSSDRKVDALRPPA